jgi:hypothetical protein
MGKEWRGEQMPLDAAPLLDEAPSFAAALDDEPGVELFIEKVGDGALETFGDLGGDAQGRTFLSAFDLGEHGGADAAASGELLEGKAELLASGADGFVEGHGVPRVAGRRRCGDGEYPGGAGWQQGSTGGGEDRRIC